MGEQVVAQERGSPHVRTHVAAGRHDAAQDLSRVQVDEGEQHAGDDDQPVDRALHELVALGPPRRIGGWPPAIIRCVQRLPVPLVSDVDVEGRVRLDEQIAVERVVRGHGASHRRARDASRGFTRPAGR